MSRHDIIGHIHGRGLFIGVELVIDHETKAPAKLAARWVRERLKSLGVLVSSTGRSETSSRSARLWSSAWQTLRDALRHSIKPLARYPQT
ncbi:hypothetical protein H6M51_20580 [Rhizobium sp. AQ_MP]|uniref:hypothetical protein n=1 Tax=Rhizobium sp. AQ_MP TaxID=2761536 RepID=UPI00163A0937|nr:hypothetical protein [Rhizobium sp. AQ_MP]MBC2775261.1 hypothetical protein [Rhizobium sp. AQ_MP]